MPYDRLRGIGEVAVPKIVEIARHTSNPNRGSDCVICTCREDTFGPPGVPSVQLSADRWDIRVITQSGRSANGYRYVIETILFLTYVVFGITWSAAGSFLGDIMADLSIGLSRASFINTSVSAAKIVGPMVAGVLLARLGPKRAFLAASFLICLGIFAPLSHGFAGILAGRFLMGLGGALVVVYFTPIVMEWFDGHERVTVNGLNFVSISIGMTVGLALTRNVRARLGGSWRTTLLVYSAASCGLFAAWLVLGKNRRRSGARRTIGETPETPETPETRAGPVHGRGGMLRALADANTWKLILAYFGLLSVYLVIITYAPSYYRYSSFFEGSSLIYLAPSAALISSIPATFAGIWFSRRVGLRIPLLRISGVLIIPGVLLMFFVHNVALVFVGAILTGFGMFFWRPALFSIPQELPGSTPQKTGYMMSVFWGVCYALGTVATWLTGRVIETTGSYAVGFILVAGLAVSMLVGSFVIPETGAGAGAGAKHT